MYRAVNVRVCISYNVQGCPCKGMYFDILNHKIVILTVKKGYKSKELVPVWVHIKYHCFSYTKNGLKIWATPVNLGRSADPDPIYFTWVNSQSIIFVASTNKLSRVHLGEIKLHFIPLQRSSKI